MKAKRFSARLKALLCTVLLVATVPVSEISAHVAVVSKAATYPYATAKNDPLKARIYKLKNGLTVYLTVNKNEPRVQTMIAVRAGSKNDPADATGLAHYLEHMLFKGTDKYGSLDYSKEKPLLDQVEGLYETYRATRDSAKRAAIYHTIDSVSGVAATFAIANEYDKMLTGLGAKGTNAYTSNEQTVYINDVPANQIKKWVTIEAERFRNPVFRIFHTELEAVYEEKNRTLDNDNRQAWELLMGEMFKNHPYGTQTTIGTVEHLKNPSIKKIKEYYYKNYVPNNMAICLSGDIDPDETIKWIDEAFGNLPSKPVEPFTFKPETPITKPVIKELYGPDAEFVTMAFRLPGVHSKEAKLLTMVNAILSNSSAGLIDLNLNQKQLVLSASSGTDILTDYSIHELYGRPKEGQTLEQVADLMLQQLELIKRGEFDDDLLPAIITDMEIGQIRAYESNGARASAFVEAFTTHQDWQEFVDQLSEYRKITKQDIIDFVKKNYNNNYIAVYKRSGPKRDVAKVTKPPITPVSVNRTAESPFVKSVLNTPASKVAPKFIDYKNDVKELKLASGIPVYYRHNDENALFSMNYIVDIGKKDDKALAVAASYLEYLGTDKMTSEQLKKKFFALGCDYSVSAGDDEVTLSLNGLSRNFSEALKLFEDVLRNAKPDADALNKYVQRSLKARTDAKKSKNTILFNAMYSYGLYGERNPFTNILSNEELPKLTAEELTKKIKDLTSYDHRVLYYGPAKEAEVVQALNGLHKVPQTFLQVNKQPRFNYRNTDKNQIYFVDYDMAQAEVIMLSKAMNYDPKLEPTMRLYNEYFGGSMSSIVFTTIRESKALAYAVRSTMATPSHPDESNYLYAYVGTQADKLPETMRSMFDLMNDMPKADNLFTQAKDAIRNKIETERISRASVLWNYERARKWNFDHDIRKDIYENVPKMSFDQIADFQKQYVKDRKYTILVLGSKNKINMDDLRKYGEIQELSLKEIFGY